MNTESTAAEPVPGDGVARPQTAIARPLPVLVPLIQEELGAGDAAGFAHYRRAGALLLEARDSVAAFKWGAWLSKNFALSRSTAWRYMKLAETGGRFGAETTIEDALGYKPRRERHAEWNPVREVTARVDADRLGQARQAREDEARLHRDLAYELIEIGFKAMAMRLHPDRGGSKDAMRRLNRVREELNVAAARRQFE
jgi:hypothetical protein